MVHSNRTLYDFSRFEGLSNFVLDIYDGNISTEDAKKEQDDLESEIKNLTDHNVKNQKKKKEKRGTKTRGFKKNARQLFEIRNRIIDALQNGVYPLPKKVQEKQTNKEEKQTEEKTIPDWVKISNHGFKRIQEAVNEHIKKGWFSKVKGKKIKMSGVKIFLRRYD